MNFRPGPGEMALPKHPREESRFTNTPSEDIAPPHAPVGFVHDRKARRRRAVRRWLGGTLSCTLGSVALLAATGTWGGIAGLAAFGFWIVWADRLMRRPGGVPVLTYHSVSADPAWLPWAAQISVTPETFDRHLSTLRRMGRRFMRTHDLLRMRQAGQAVPAGTVVLHLDDGYLDNWVAAAPILARHVACATLFASLDFIDPSPGPRPCLGSTAPLRWDGYCSWAELRALDASCEIDVQPHGVDHGRVATGPRPVAELSEQNWRRLAWVQWAALPGSKHDWYLAAEPLAQPFGTIVRENGTALGSLAWTESEGIESASRYRARVESHLCLCRDVFRRELGKTPEIFCWPENEASPAGRHVAEATGFSATTGGRGENRPEEDARVISRVHAGDRAAGFHWPWAEGVFIRATVRTFEGNLYWYFPLVALAVLRKPTLALRGLVHARAARWAGLGA